MSDKDIELEIQAKGLTSPRITTDRINQVIRYEHYFTAAEGVIGAFVADEKAKGNAGTLPCDVSDLRDSLQVLTFCVLTLQNGFTVTGESACASPENFNAEIGRKIARDNAVNKVWMLEGYLLKQQLNDSNSPQ